MRCDARRGAARRALGAIFGTASVETLIDLFFDVSNLIGINHISR